MGFWRRFFNRKVQVNTGEDVKASKDLEENFRIIKEDFLKDCDDVIYRRLEIGVWKNYKAAIICLDGMADKNLVNDFALNNLMLTAREVRPEPSTIKKNLYELVKSQTLAVAELDEVDTINDGVIAILSGETVLLLDGHDKIIIIASKGWPARTPEESDTETVIRGPRDGMVETSRFNTTLIRRRIRDHRLKLKDFQVGTRSKTDVSLLYMEDIASPKLVEKVEERLKKVDVDAIIDSGQLEEFIEDKWFSPFPQIQNTERPDTAASALYHGRVVLVVDNTPFALIVPTTFNIMMQSAEDYYSRWDIATFIRILRYSCILIALYSPALYVALTAFHPQMIPSGLALGILATRRDVPFPAVVEAFVMEVTLEILREAGVRLPGAIGSTIGIVGGLVIGQAAVEAGLVSPLMVIVVSITAIATFAIPNYNLAITIRILRFAMLFIAASFGLYGIMLFTLVILIHLCSLKSFGTPYLTPFVHFFEATGDLKDTIARAPYVAMHNRSIFAVKEEKNLMDDHREEDFNKEE